MLLSRRHLKVLVVGWTLACLGFTTAAASSRTAVSSRANSDDAKALFSELSRVSIDPQNTFQVQEINIDRDALHFTLHRGVLAFFTPVRGVVTGAVFLGAGEILVIPPNPIEKLQLNKFTDSPILTEAFPAAIFRFTDDTFAQVTRTLRESSASIHTDVSLKETWDEGVRNLSLNLNYNILQNLLSKHPPAYFHASLDGLTQGWFEAVQDGRALEPIVLGRVTVKEGIHYPDIWCSFRSPRDPIVRDPMGQRRLALYDLKEVSIDAHISETAALDATARLNLSFLADGERLIPFELSRGLKINAVEDDSHHSLTFFQNDLLAPGEAMRRGNDQVYVLLPGPEQAGESIELTFHYAGSVITDLGNGVYFVGARGTWYPNHGLTDLARYHLKFLYPASMNLVATGKLIHEANQEKEKSSEWDSETPIGVAGFNYGDYIEKKQSLGPVELEVYANRSLEDYVRQLQVLRQQIQSARMATATPENTRPRGIPSFPTVDLPPLPAISSEVLLNNINEATAAALKFYESWFGPYPFSKIAISQIPGRFGQGWPTLCYVSTLAFLTPDQQESLGMSRDAQVLFAGLMQAHEIAHQWWGNLVVPQTYHETWLIEGMANYASLLYANEKDSKQKTLDQELQKMKDRLLERTHEGATNESAGPIWLGWRLESSKSPSGYYNAVYDKATWIIHMMRMMMRDPSTQSDERFITALKSFLTEYKEAAVSSADFQRALEKHMTAQMNLDKNRSLDWFFDEWVYDVGIPEYRLRYSIGGSAEKGFFVSGKITQSGVSSLFEMPVPVFAHYGNRDVRLSSVVVSGAETAFRIRLPQGRFKPNHITLNDDESVLCTLKSN
ncbi:MAG: M1 family aminopeptidase [Acidobacteriia bacterium]|nr:M1 family aminopeptidase [Terriglobia bacterium]